MSKIQVTLHIDDHILMDESQQASLSDAIDQELGWLHDSGMFVEGWSFIEREQAPKAKANTKSAIPLDDQIRNASTRTLPKQGRGEAQNTDPII